MVVPSTVNPDNSAALATALAKSASFRNDPSLEFPDSDSSQLSSELHWSVRAQWSTPTDRRGVAYQLPVTCYHSNYFIYFLNWLIWQSFMLHTYFISLF